MEDLLLLCFFSKGFFKQFDMFTHGGSRRGKYQKKRRGNDPFA